LDGQRTYTLTVALIPDGGTELDAVQVTDDLNYYGIPPTEEIVIDIKPGSDINPINLRSQGVVPVALIDFDPALLEDPASQIIFAGATALRWAVEDVDGDGDLDVICHFKTQELNLDADSTSAGVQIGTSYDEAVDQQVGGYAGEDTVSIVPKGEAKGHAKTSTSSSSTKGNKGGNGKNKNK
jgi:hypothetical protein